MPEKNRLWRSLEYGLMSYYVGSETVSIAQAHPSVAVPAVYGGMQALAIGGQALFSKFNTGKASLDEKRWSAFWVDHQSDRYWALSGLSRVSKLVRCRD